jgi:hypothetical protein
VAHHSRLLKKPFICVLGRLSGPGRLTNSAARTNVALLIRRAVRPCNVDCVRSVATLPAALLKGLFEQPGEENMMNLLGQEKEKNSW